MVVTSLFLAGSAAALDHASEQLLSFAFGATTLLAKVPASAFSVPYTLSCSSASVGVSGKTDMLAAGFAFDLLATPASDPRAAITLILRYDPALAAGRTETHLVLCRLDPTTGAWTQVPTVPDPANDLLTATIDRWGTFAIAERVPATDLAAVFAYPNPYRPASGTRFDRPGEGTGIVFARLPAAARIRVFTLTGELVRDLNFSDGNGTCVWDTANDRGDPVASGVYVYLVSTTDPPARTAHGKIAIIR